MEPSSTNSLACNHSRMILSSHSSRTLYLVSEKTTSSSQLLTGCLAQTLEDRKVALWFGLVTPTNGPATMCTRNSSIIPTLQQAAMLRAPTPLLRFRWLKRHSEWPPGSTGSLMASTRSARSLLDLTLAGSGDLPLVRKL